MPHSSPLVLATSGDKGLTLASSSHLGSPPGGLLWLTQHVAGAVGGGG